jgi:predicted SAM-dependent methyltransferase
MKALKLPALLVEHIVGHFKYGGIKGVARLMLALPLKKLGFVYSRAGFKDHYCPCCNWRGKNFLPYISGGYVTFQAVCPKCTSHPRHRGQMLFYYRMLNIKQRRERLLYFAPEYNILQRLKSDTPLEIYTSEYESKTADFHFDLMDVRCDDNTWELIICHRVIEHLPDDRKGMDELYRILKPGGELILSVPINPARAETLEYGNPNPLEDYHYYNYGKDFEERIPAEFIIKKYAFSELFSAEEFRQLSLTEDWIFLCKKRQ